VGYKGLVAATLLLTEDVNLKEKSKKGEAGLGWKPCLCRG
jgi:hypothetical protein